VAALLGDEHYTDRELDGLNTWIPLTDDRLPDDNFMFYYAKFKSGSPELTELFLDPKAVLLDGFGSLPALRTQNDWINEDTRINTTIFRHDRSLKLRFLITIAAVDQQDNSVSMTSHKAT
jgi:hypothetical protein